MARPIAETIAGHVAELCAHGDRNVGGPGNRRATGYVAGALAAAGLEVARLAFDCIAWEPHGSSIEIAGAKGDQPGEPRLLPSPYSVPFRGEAELVSASSAEELETVNARGRVLLLHGPIVSEQLTPRHYPFYQMDSHARILDLLERAKPAAIVAATGRNPGFAGALYPFPFIEDAAFDIPSAYLTDVEGACLLPHVGGRVRLEIGSSRIPTSAEQLVAVRPGTGASGRLVICAHLDSKPATPGALDNAAGVACLLALAEVLRDAELAHDVEFVPFNGEDNYAAPGEMAYLAAHGRTLADVRLAVNIDAPGLLGSPSAFSFYGCPETVREAAVSAAASRPEVQEGPEWPQSDHMVFAMRAVPALAVTSARFETISAEISHTERDTPDLVDADVLAGTVEWLAALLGHVDRL